ncbi:hypothetical protein SY84_13760 [Deinococcus soli (ex Cha et al. 2016)]|uniref:Uncharacterized protein n=1 Tax=Deinococcus soli (ex Cha et al. 2016) TaxID=1309411 RepID=A0A0F7JRB1_9DEIO|nr:hypothetical protein SY84_13760 [Deinococcus soli (ex Cha et al. 2016)]
MDGLTVQFERIRVGAKRVPGVELTIRWRSGLPTKQRESIAGASSHKWRVVTVGAILRTHSPHVPVPW